MIDELDMAVDVRMANYTIKTQTKEIDRLKGELKASEDKRIELQEENRILRNEAERYSHDLSMINNIVKEALKEDA